MWQDANSARGPGPVDIHAVSRHALVKRIAASSAFQKSNRLRELLLFLCERTLADPDAVIHESEIGTEVFGRQSGYDTAQDPLVRVQVSQLRKKLQQYFTSEGRAERITIEIPKGAYTPVFCERPIETPAAVEVPEAKPKNRRKLWLVLTACAVAAVVLGVGLWALLRTVQPEPVRAGEAGPERDRFWRELFANGRPACVVLSDPNLVTFEDMLHYQLTVDEYRRKEFKRLADEYIKDPEQNLSARIMMVNHTVTHVVDAQVAASFSVLNAAQQAQTDVVASQDFGVGYFQSHNVILLGSRRANPWMEPFESQLNFRTVHTETDPPDAYFVNTAPLAGENPTYHVEWGFRGYCRVAYLPAPSRSGTVIVISGTDMASTQAGGQFIASDRWIRALESRLKISAHDPFPYFELLLRVEYTARNTSPRFSIVTHRTPKL